MVLVVFGWHFEQNVFSDEGKTRALKSSEGSGNKLKVIIETVGAIKFGRTEEAKSIRKENMAKGKDTTPFQAKEITGVDYEKMGSLTTSSSKDNLLIVAQRGRGENNEQQLEPRNDGKTNCLTSVQKDNLIMQINPSKESGGVQPYQQNRIYDSNGISPALCANKADLLIKTEILGCDYRTDEGFRFRENGKSGTLAARARTDESCGQLAYVNKTIRRLTPRECGRLQSIPEDKLEILLKCGISDSQLYKMFGNGWNIKVISHILQYLKISNNN